MRKVGNTLCLLSLISLFGCAGDDPSDVDDPVGSDSPAPATPMGLSLLLDTHDSAAGESVGYTVTLTWSDDSTSSPAEPVSSDLQPDLSVDRSSIVPTLAGDHTITARAQGLQATATLSVSPGAPDRVDLTLDPVDGLDPTDSSTATVQVWDAFDNVVPIGSTLVVSPQGATVDGLVVTFDQDGAYTLTATPTDSDVTARVGPIVIDSRGPNISIDPPARGAWLQPADRAVGGRAVDELSDLAGVTVNEDPQIVDSEGSFETTVDWDFGMNPLICRATDSDGNSSIDSRAVLVGDTLVYGTPDADGIIVRIHDGAGGLQAIAALLTGAVDAKTLQDSLPDPLYYGAKRECTTIFGKTICVDQKLTFVAKGLRFKTVTATLDATKGELLTTLVIDDPELDWLGTGEASSVRYSDTGTATADSITVTATLRLKVVASALEVDISKVEATVKDLDLGLSGSMKTVLSRLGVSLDTKVASLLEDAVVDAVEEDLPGELEDALGDLGWTQDIAMGESTATVTGALRQVQVDDLGVTVELATTVSLDRWRSPREGPGSLAADYAAPRFLGKPGAVVGLDQDFVNQLLYASWGSGMMHTQASATELGIDAALVKVLLPDIEELYVVVDALYPPVAVPGRGTDLLDLGVADVQVSFYDGDPSGEPPYRFYVHGVAGLDMAVKGGVLVATTGPVDLRVHIDRAPDAVDQDALGEVMQSLLPSVLDGVVGTLAEIDLPAPGGLTITAPTVSLLGPDKGFVAVGGALK